MEILDKMADIELPAPPDWSGFILVTALTVLFVVITLGVWWYLKQNRQTPLSFADEVDAAFSRIESEWSSGKINDREASYLLSTLLRLGLGLKQLTRNCPKILATDNDYWQKTISLFDHLRYKPTSPQRLSSVTFQRIKTWLNTAKPAQEVLEP